MQSDAGSVHKLHDTAREAVTIFFSDVIYWCATFSNITKQFININKVSP